MKIRFMPSTRRFRVALNLCRLALLCLVCIWGGSFALEINADKLQSLRPAAAPRAQKAVASWLHCCAARCRRPSATS